MNRIMFNELKRKFNGFESQEQYDSVLNKVKKLFPDVKDVELEKGWKVNFIKDNMWADEECMMIEHINMI